MLSVVVPVYNEERSVELLYDEVASALDLQRLGRLTHSYQLVEGTVAPVGEGGGRIYLNFAKDWRSDFTISVDRKDAPAFAAAGIDLKALPGKRLRVRGFLGWRNGPIC